jgi:hypothetical protein
VMSNPRALARTTGAIYLFYVVAGIVAQELISERLIVWGDAAATASHILSHESLFRLGFTIYLIEMVGQIVTTILFYQLLKPVNKTVALVAVILGVVGCTIKTLGRLFYYAPLLIVGAGSSLNGFDTNQAQALSLLLLKVNDHAAAMALVLFGFESVLEGYLIIRSTFLPRILGILAVIGGFGWLAFLWPPLGYRVFPYVAAFALLGLLATIAWLLIVGVNEERWKAQAAEV